MDTKSKQTIGLKSVTTTKSTDYYLEVKSETTALKETGMKNQFEQRLKQNYRKYILLYTAKEALKK